MNFYILFEPLILGLTPILYFKRVGRFGRTKTCCYDPRTIIRSISLIYTHRILSVGTISDCRPTGKITDVLKPNLNLICIKNA